MMWFPDDGCATSFFRASAGIVGPRGLPSASEESFLPFTKSGARPYMTSAKCPDFFPSSVKTGVELIKSHWTTLNNLYC